MDEASRRLERSSRASGDRLERVRAANARLRADDAKGALDLLKDLDPKEASGLETTTRALATLRTGDAGGALAVLERAAAAGAELEIELEPLLLTLAPALEGRVPLGRPRVARFLSRMEPGRRPGPLVQALEADKDPLVRIALRITERPAFTKDERVSRVYGSHGADYETGRFIAFDATLEMRVRTFELALFESIGKALATIARDPHFVETLALRTSFGDGWGLGGNDHEIDERVLADAIAAFNELDLVPWRVRDVGVRPYDLMKDERRFVRRLARDIGGHPIGRQAAYDANAPLLARFLAKHPFRGQPCPWAELEPLIDEARRTFSRLGSLACEDFAHTVRGQLRL
ncbi:MAG TPA: hypothetical protein VFF73_12875 [Planctomycetota bacterium]|nr:hypothetical protein [Planctomycetota bacterium]